MGEKLRDTFGRTFPYIRLSITDVCNFKCGYCLPNGYFKPNNHPGFLNISEIENLVNGLSDLGVSKIRVTGGEPTARKFLLLEFILTFFVISTPYFYNNYFNIN